MIKESMVVEAAKFKGEINDAMQSKESYLELLDSRHDTYRYREETDCFSSVEIAEGSMDHPF